MQALASPPETAYLQRYPLRDDVPAPAPVATPLTPPDPSSEAPPPAGTTGEVGMAPAPQSVRPASGPNGPDDDALTPTAESPTTQPVDTTDRRDGDDGPSTGVIVGIAVIVAAVFICVAAAICVIAQSRRKHRAKAMNAEPVRACGWP